MPQSQGNLITYKFYPGDFLRALSIAYRSILDGTQEHTLLVIDELNRGNAAAIFGNVFQLLDRESDGWSSYEVDLSDLELMTLFNMINYKSRIIDDVIIIKYKQLQKFCLDKEEELELDGARLMRLLSGNKISIPPNLSILATINTSDESIYYLDSAFKRRWDWEYIESPTDIELVPETFSEVKLVLENDDYLNWATFVVGLNQFIRSNSQSIRRILEVEAAIPSSCQLSENNWDDYSYRTTFECKSYNFSKCISIAYPDQPSNYHTINKLKLFFQFDKPYLIVKNSLPSCFYSYWEIDVGFLGTELAVMRQLNHIFYLALRQGTWTFDTFKKNNYNSLKSVWQC